MRPLIVNNVLECTKVLMNGASLCGVVCALFVWAPAVWSRGVSWWHACCQCANNKRSPHQMTGANTFGYTMAPENAALVPKYTSASAMTIDMSPAIAEEVSRIWKDEAIQKTYEDRARLQLPDSAKHVLDNVARIAAPGFVPTFDDILRCRARTTGIHEILFKVQSYIFRMVDVGGQRSERKKWVHW